MKKDDFRNSISDWLDKTDPSTILTIIPAGETLFRIIGDVTPERYIPGFVSTGGGRWSPPGMPTVYGATTWDAAAYETGRPRAELLKNCRFEQYSTTKRIDAFPIEALPQDLQDSLFENTTSNTPEKWENSRILLEELERRPNYARFDAIFAPSASGLVHNIPGYCFAIRYPDAQGMELVEGGDFRWFQSKTRSSILRDE